MQDANEVLDTAVRAMLLLQRVAQLAEDGRQLPAAEDIGMIERRWLELQGFQIMPRVEDLLVLSVGTGVRSDDLAAQHHVDALDVRLDRGRLKGGRARHAVTVVVKAHHLVLVHFGRFDDARIEAALGQRQRFLLLADKALADRFGLTGLNAVAVALATRAQVSVQRRQVLNLRDRRRPVALQVADAALDVRLLLRPANHAEQRLEGVMAAQRLVAVVELTLPADEDVRRDGLGIVPPHLPRHRSEEVEGFDQSVQDRLGAFRRQSDDERTVGIRPGRQQHRHEPPAAWKVDMNVSEVRFETLTRIVIERDERLAVGSLPGQHVAPDPIVTTGEAVFVAEPAKDLRRRVPLLARRGLVGAENLVNHRLQRIDDRGHRPAPVRLRLGHAEDLSNLPPRMMKPPGQLAYAQLVNAMRLANPCVLVHLDHPPPPVVWLPVGCTSLQEVAEGGPVFDKHFSPGVGPVWTSITKRVLRALPDAHFMHESSRHVVS